MKDKEKWALAFWVTLTVIVGIPGYVYREVKDILLHRHHQ